ncbi:MAG: TIGR04076 family protein [Chloroflexi bacterium]|nr:TIGR04076 family protein [Chloroflexota bacterium]
MADIIARVVSQKGTCAAGHKAGDEFVIGQVTPHGLCAWAHYTLFPFAQVLQFGGVFPWEADPDRAMVACPDPGNPVVFELRRGYRVVSSE